MAIPSGSGTEVLKRVIIDGLGTSEGTLITGVANHIYTILSISVAQRNTSATTFSLYVDPSAGGTDMYMLDAYSIPGDSHFIWNDKFVLSGTDKLHVVCNRSDSIDIICSYIDQDWS
jgi:hypothetical protein